MEIQDIRRARLAQLIDERYEGSQSKFIERTGENQSEVSALLRHKSFGEKKARKIEVKAELPVGWLDDASGLQPNGNVETDSSERFRQRVVLSVVEKVEPQWMALVYVTQKELDLLSLYRRASDIGKSLVETAAESAAGDMSGSGSAHQS